MKKISIMLLSIILIVTNISSISAASKEYSPTAEFFINDFANVLSQQVKQEIYSIGRNVEAKTTAQLVVVTVPNMNGLDIESYANTLFNKWGIGTKDKDNGVLLLLSKDDKKIRIEVGYGLEGALNDAKVGRILDKYAINPLKQDNYDTAILTTVRQIQGEIYNEYNIDNKVENPNYVPDNMNIQIDAKYIWIGIGIFVFLVIITKGKILEVLFWILMLSNRRRFWRRLWW